jgi:LacI family transcriptional regulator
LHKNWVFYRPLEYREHKFRQRLFAVLEALHPDGILMREPPQMDEIVKMGVPIVSFSYTRATIAGVANAVADHIAVGQMAAEHLLERGLRQFAYCGFDDWWWSRERRKGFSQRAGRAGFPVHVYRLPRVTSQRTWHKEIVAIANWLNKLTKPLCVMACNDDRGALVIEACKAARLGVPDEVAVVGVDNDPTLCDLCSPPLSSVALSLHKSGYEAAALLDRMMTIGACRTQKLHIRRTHVVSRLSSDVLAVDDQAVAAALRYIRQHGKEYLSIPQVVAHSGTSRRPLERRFRDTLGRTIRDEIQQVRVGLVKTLLVETPMSLKEIAKELDFASVPQVSRYFHKATGLSPAQYRKRFAP